jgi:arginine decarboxylase
MTNVNDMALGMKVLIVDDEIDLPTAEGRAVRALVDELKKGDATVIKSGSADDGKSVILSDPSIQCILMDWSLDDDDPQTHNKARELLKLIRTRNIHMPVFLMADSEMAPLINAEVMSLVDELVWVLEDTPTFIAGRVLAAMHRYRDQIEPPFTKALMNFAKVSEYSWHTPGHTGGTAFLKSPVGRAFFQYFGENLLRSDLSVSVGELGSLLDHSGPIGESEKYAAQIFGADRTYSVTNGTSASNRIVFMASVTRGDHVLVDRNCHKSIEQALIMTGAIPAYMKTSRNHLGLIGPIYPENIGKKAVTLSILLWIQQVRDISGLCMRLLPTLPMTACAIMSSASWRSWAIALIAYISMRHGTAMPASIHSTRNGTACLKRGDQRMLPRYSLPPQHTSCSQPSHKHPSFMSGTAKNASPTTGSMNHL